METIGPSGSQGGVVNSLLRYFVPFFCVFAFFAVLNSLY